MKVQELLVYHMKFIQSFFDQLDLKHSFADERDYCVLRAQPDDVAHRMLQRVLARGLASVKVKDDSSVWSSPAIDPFCNMIGSAYNDSSMSFSIPDMCTPCPKARYRGRCTDQESLTNEYQALIDELDKNGAYGRENIISQVRMEQHLHNLRMLYRIYCAEEKEENGGLPRSDSAVSA